MAKVFTFYIVAPISVLDVPIGGSDMTVFTDFIKYDENDKPIGRYTLNEYCNTVNTNRKMLYTVNGEFAYFGWNLSDLSNNMVNIKALMAYYGYIPGGVDFTNLDPNAFWILNADEIDEWLKVSPHNIVPTEETQL